MDWIIAEFRLDFEKTVFFFKISAKKQGITIEK